MRKLTLWSLAGSLVVLAAAMVVPTKASADTMYSFYPTSGTANLGVTSYSVSGANGPITVEGFDCASTPTPCNGTTGTATNLAWKNLGSGEAGTGIANDPDGAMEISDDDFVTLDMSKLKNSSGTLWVSSVQSGQLFEVCFSSSASVLGTDCIPDLGAGKNLYAIPISWTSSDPFVQITGYVSDSDFNFTRKASSSDDVLVGAFTTPEPGTLLLLGVGLLGLGGLMLSRRRPVVDSVIA